MICYLFQALVLATLAEHTLPFTLGPVIIETAKALSHDPEVLKKLEMKRISVGYKMRYGMGPAFHSKIIENLKSGKFSLNIDESTASNSQHILTMLANFYNRDRGVIVTEHLKFGADHNS